MKLQILVVGFETLQTDKGIRYRAIIEMPPLERPEALELFKKTTEQATIEVTLQ